jgi:hypothetical protein
LFAELLELQFLPLFGDLSIPSEYMSFTCKLPAPVAQKISVQQDKEIEKAMEGLYQAFSGIKDVSTKKLEFYSYLEYAVVLCLGENLLFPFVLNCLTSS